MSDKINFNEGFVITGNDLRAVAYEEGIYANAYYRTGATALILSEAYRSPIEAEKHIEWDRPDGFKYLFTALMSKSVQKFTRK